MNDRPSCLRRLPAALITASAVLLAIPGAVRAQTPPPPSPPPAAAKADPVITPKDYVIGADDVLSVVFWREKDMSAEVAVRPDGKISLPLLNDVQAAGLTPEQLRTSLTQAATPFLAEPAVSVIVKQINSLRVFITGEIRKPGAYPLTSPTTVMQLIALAGGLTEFADKQHVVVMHRENGLPSARSFDYEALSKQRNLFDNVLLKPGDTVIVP